MANDGHVKIGTEIDKSGLEKGLSGMSDSVKGKLEGIGSFAQKGFSAIGNAAAAVSKVAVGAIGAAASGVAALGTASIAAGTEFETSMAKASTLFGDVEVNTQKLNADILKISDSTGIAASELNESLYSALSAGIPATEDMAEATSFLESSARLAKAGFTDMDTALTATAKTLNAYGLDVSEADRINKILIQTQNKGITTVGELGQSLAQVTPTAAAFGVSFENVGAALANMTAAGTPTAQATTQLNALIAELGKSGTTGAKALEAAAAGTEYAGMTFKEMADAGVPLNDILDLIADSASESGLSMVDMFSSIEAGKAALALSGENSEKFASNLEAMGTSADVVTEAYEKVTSTLATKTEQMKNSAENLGIAIYQGLQEPLMGLADMGLGYLDELSSAFQQDGVEGLISAGAGIVSNLLLGAAQMLPELIEIAGRVVGYLTQSISENLPQLLQAGAQILLSLGAGILSAAGQFLSLGAAILSNLASGLEAKRDILVGNGKRVIGNIAQGIIENLPGIIESGIRIISTLAMGIAQMLPELFSAAADIIITLATSLTDPAVLTNILNAAVSIIEGLVFGLLENLPQIAVAAITIIANLATTLISNVPRLMVAAINILSALGRFLVESVGVLLAAIPKLFIEIVRGFVEQDWAQIGRNIIDGIVNGVVEAAHRLVEAAMAAVKNAISNVKSFLGIASPSKLMRDLIGKNIIAGIGVGIEMETPELLHTADSSVSRLVSGMKAKAYNVYPEYRVENLKDGPEGISEKTGGGDVINNFNFYEPVETPDETARAIRKMQEFGLAGA